MYVYIQMYKYIYIHIHNIYEIMNTPVFLGFPGGSVGEESTCNVGELGFLIPGLGRSPCRKAWRPTPVLLPGESPRTEEPGGLQSMGSQRVGNNWVIKYTAHKYM